MRGSSFRPTALTFNSTAWRGGKPYDAADIPIPNYMVSQGVDRTILEQQFAYEWFDVSGRYSSGHNPPFTKGSAGRLLPQFIEDGTPQRILRGFIRRAEYDVADSKSTARLYFMYNPETITRDYVSYLDQGALDPFNTIYQSGNLVPPPSLLDFSFSLLFDRQEEASQNPDFPGVFVDYEYFDLVVRNVIPSYEPGGASSGGSELPDNGVMMINPREITVVFSPNITVQGRPYQARVNFLKFTHRMIPIRMQIDLTIRATYFGPMKDMVEYKAETAAVTDSVPWTYGNPSDILLKNQDIYDNAQLFFEQMKANLLTDDQITTILGQLKESGQLPDSIDGLLSNNLGASGSLNQQLADWAYKIATDPSTKTSYTDNSGLRSNLWTNSDCSSWIWGVFASHSSKANMTMGGVWSKGTWENKKNIPATGGMIDDMPNRPVKPIFQNRIKDKAGRSAANLPKVALLMPGDLLYRKQGVFTDKGHVAMVYKNDGQQIQICHSGGGNGKPATTPTYSYASVAENYTEAYRPMLGNPDSPGNRPAGISDIFGGGWGS